MGFIRCVQGQAEGIREPLVLIPISEGIPQDVQESFGVQESQEYLEDLHLALDWEQSTPLFSGEIRDSFQLVWEAWTGPPGRGAYPAAWFRAGYLDLRST